MNIKVWNSNDHYSSDLDDEVKLPMNPVFFIVEHLLFLHPLIL